MNTTLVPSLEPLNMVVTRAVFTAARAADTPYNLANIADFNSLIALSQTNNVPIFALTDTQLNQAGIVLENMIASRDNFRETFDSLAQCVINLIRV